LFTTGGPELTGSPVVSDKVGQIRTFEAEGEYSVTASELEAPVIVDVNLNTVKRGGALRIEGSHLGSTTKATFKIGTVVPVDASVTVINDTELTGVVPSKLNAGVGTVSATNKAGPSNEGEITIIP
jgi:hypothetical protein